MLKVFRQRSGHKIINLSSEFTNNTGADPCRLISAFVIRSLESIISMQQVNLIIVAEETCLNIVLSETRGIQVLSRRGPHILAPCWPRLLSEARHVISNNVAL